jgi:hypothetical protein
VVGIEEIEQKLLALPLKHRVFLAESLLDSVPLVAQEMTEAEEMAEVECREQRIESGQVRALTDEEFWRSVASDLKSPRSRFP